MSYNSKYTGAQVEELLDQIASGEVDNVYVTDFTFYDLFDVFYSEGEASKAADIASLLAAAQANKIIIVPISSEAKSGCVANLNVYDEAIQLWFYYFSTRIELYLSSTSTEIKAEDVWMEDVQSALISGETIKTINGEEILGGGDIELATKEELNGKQDAIADLDTIRSGAAKGATALQSYTEKYTGTITGIKMNGASKGTSGVVDLGTVITAHQDISGKADDTSVVHKTGNESISGAKTFNGGVNFLGSGDSNAVTLSTNTRINVNGTNQTVLGFGSGSFYINHGNYNLLLRGKATRPTYNGADMALYSDIPAAVTESTVSGWGFTKNTGTYSKPSTGIPKSDLASAVQTSLGKADTALQSYTEQYKGTVTGVKINGTTKNPSSGIVDLGTVITSHQDISGKQDKLVSGTNIKTINGTSLLGSGNIVISGGGGSSSGSGAYAEVNHGTSDTTFALTPNTFHVWDEVRALTLTLGSETAGVANEFLFQFTSGATATSLTLPDDIKWANDAPPTIAENMIYQISILNGLAVVLEFNNAVVLVENWCTVTGAKTFEFQYPVASELTVNLGGKTATVPVGETSGSVSGMVEPGVGIISIYPDKDSTYIYLY